MWLLRRSIATIALAAAAALAVAGCGDAPKQRRARPPIVATPAPGHAAGPTPASRALTAALDSSYHRYAHDLVGACMGAIVERTAVTRCYGRTSRESSARPTPTTLFQVGSIAKTISATLLAMRVEQGKVRLDDPLRRYIPARDGADRIPSALTLELAATHHSGLPRTTPVDQVASLDEYLGLAGRCEAAPGCALATPGQAYVYSNFTYGVLGQALALHDGYRPSRYSGWEKDVRDNVTGPLAMPDTRSWFGWRATGPAEFDRRRARAFMGDPPRESDPPYYPPAPYGDPAAGLYSTAADMLRWLSFSMGASGTGKLAAARPLLYDTPRLIRTRESGDPRRSIGLAWDVDTYGSGSRRTVCISKDGAARGFSANMVFVAAERRGAFVMLNSRPESVSTPQIASELVNALPKSPIARGRPGRCGVFQP